VEKVISLPLNMSSEHFWSIWKNWPVFSAPPPWKCNPGGGEGGGEFKRGMSSLLGRGSKGAISVIIRFIDPRKQPRWVAGTLVNKLTKKKNPWNTKLCLHHSYLWLASCRLLYIYLREACVVSMYTYHTWRAQKQSCL